MARTVRRAPELIKPPFYVAIIICFFGTPKRIRTSDLRIRSPLLYPAELWAHAENEVLILYTLKYKPYLYTARCHVSSILSIQNPPGIFGEADFLYFGLQFSSRSPDLKLWLTGKVNIFSLFLVVVKIMPAFE